MAKENILSVFIDESGDFGQFDPKHPMYYVAMVLHEQTNDISDNIAMLDNLITNWADIIIFQEFNLFNNLYFVINESYMHEREFSFSIIFIQSNPNRWNTINI